MSNSLWPQALQTTRLLCPWDFPGKNTGVGCHFLLQGIFQTQGWNSGLLFYRPIIYHWNTSKESNCNVGDLGLIPGLGRSPGEGKGYPFLYSGLENSMDRAVHGSQRVGHDWATFSSHLGSPWFLLLEHYWCIKITYKTNLQPQALVSAKIPCSIMTYWMYLFLCWAFYVIATDINLTINLVTFFSFYRWRN